MATRSCNVGLHQIGNIIAFLFAIILNGLSSMASRPLGATNADISAERKTAFTPAGYAFSIWGIIYTLAGIALTWQCFPAQKEFVEKKLSVFLMLNFVGNGCWIVAFATQALDLWLSTVIIFGGILAPLMVLHRRLAIGENISQKEWGESFMDYFISTYLGWTCVACIANFSLTLVHYNMGNQIAWSIVMQIVAFGLGVIFLAKYSDWLVAMPIAWALVAIAVQQESPDYPGGPHTVLTGYSLGGILWALSLGVLMHRCYVFFITSKSNTPLLESVQKSQEESASQSQGNSETEL